MAAPRSPAKLPVGPSRSKTDVIAALTRGGTAAVILRIRKGVPARHLNNLAKALGMSAGDFCSALGMKPSAQARRIRERRALPPHESNLLVRTAMVLERAIQVFGSMEAAGSWLRQSIIALGGVSPLSLLDTGFGAELVERALVAIEHGHPA